MASFLLCLYTGKNIYERSRCDTCDHVLSVLDLIPIVSYIILKGKCRYCNNEINKKYFIYEIVVGLLFLIVYLKYDYSFHCIFLMIIICIMYCISINDIDSFIIPMHLNILLVIVKYVFYGININEIINALMVSLTIYLISLVFKKLNKKEMMGFGDIKLLFCLGLYMSIINSILAIFIGSMIALVTCLFFHRKNTYFPFGPYICIGFLIMLIFSKEILTFYLNL